MTKQVGPRSMMSVSTSGAPESRMRSNSERPSSEDPGARSPGSERRLSAAPVTYMARQVAHS